MHSILKNNQKSDLDYFFDISVDPLAVFGSDKKFKKISKTCLDVFGWVEEELLSETWSKYVHEDDIVKIKEHLNKDGILNGVRGIELRCKCKNGNYIWVECNYKYIPNDDIYIATARDISERKALQQEKAEYQKTIELESMKNEFFSNISHEFKTPLNIILATMQVINKNIEDKKIVASEEVDLERYMTSIKQNCFRLLRLVSNIIDINKIDSGYYQIQMGNYNIVSIVEDITMSVLEYINNKGLQLIFDTEMEEEIIACDPDKIERIILNLLSNAIKYTPEDGKIKVNINKDNEWVYICVEDNGMGIPEEKLQTIFKMYKQIDNKITRSWNGSGVGLALVKSLVEMQGGRIHAESKEGEGSKFIVKLPIKTIACKDIKQSNELGNSKIEKCNIEFSDIYK